MKTLNSLKLATAIAMSLNISAYAGPTGGTITSGSGEVERIGKTTNIIQNTSRLDINWKDFSSKKGETINFEQPSSKAVAINRVTGSLPSTLNGTLNANGRVFVINQNGITFGAGSRTNVGSLVATTAKDAAIDKKYNFEFKNAVAPISNNGTIKAANKGSIIMVAPEINNGTRGVIQADQGSIILHAASSATFNNAGLSTDETDESADSVAINNAGRIQAKSGNISLNALAPISPADVALNLDGIVDATSFSSNGKGGGVMLSSSGDVNVGAKVTADARGNAAGGSIGIFSKNGGIYTTEDSSLSAKGSGTGSGGSVDIRRNDNYAPDDTLNHNIELDGDINTSAGNKGIGGVISVNNYSTGASAGNITISETAELKNNSFRNPKTTPGSYSIESPYVYVRNYQSEDSVNSLSTGGDVEISGTINTDGIGNANGGNTLIGNNIANGTTNITSTANISAQGGEKSGNGGRIEINSLNSNETNIDGVISSDATTSGKGGTVSITSNLGDLNVLENANISATGGTLNGDGGVVNLSRGSSYSDDSSGNLNLYGQIDTSAGAKGIGGTVNIKNTNGQLNVHETAMIKSNSTIQWNPCQGPRRCLIDSEKAYINLSNTTSNSSQGNGQINIDGKIDAEGINNAYGGYVTISNLNTDPYKTAGNKIKVSDTAEIIASGGSTGGISGTVHFFYSKSDGEPVYLDSEGNEKPIKDANIEVNQLAPRSPNSYSGIIGYEYSSQGAYNKDLGI